MSKFLTLIIVSKPILDLFWDFKIMGINISGLVAFLLTILYFIIILINYKHSKLYLNKYSFMLSIYSLISCFFFIILPKSDSIISSLTNMLRLISPMVILIYLGNNLKINNIEKIMNIYILVSLIPIIISFLQVAGIVEYTYWDYIGGNKIARASGGYRHPSVLTRLLIITNLFSLYFTSTTKKLKYYIYILISCLSIFLTYHRTGYLLICMTMLLWIALNYKKTIISVVKFIGILLSIMIVLVIILNTFNFDTEFISMLNSLVSIDNIFRIENGEFIWVLRGRAKFIELLINSIKNQQWYFTILGNGIDKNAYTGLSMYTADMDFIRILWQYGFIGILLWLGQMVTFMRGCLQIKKYKNMNDKYNKMINLTIIIIICYIFFGFTIEATMSPNFMYIIYLFVSFILGNRLKYKDINNNSSYNGVI